MLNNSYSYSNPKSKLAHSVLSTKSCYLPQGDVEQDPEAPHVGVGPDGAVGNHLRGQELEARLDLWVGQVFEKLRPDFLRRTEIDQPDDFFGRVEKRIFGLEIEVDDVLGVEIVERVEDLLHVEADGQLGVHHVFAEVLEDRWPGESEKEG